MGLEFDFAHRPFQAEQEPIVGIARIGHPILIRQEGAKERTHFQHMMPVFGTACQPTHLQPQDEADMIHGDLGEEPLEPGAPLRRRTTLPLILVNDEHTGRGSAQRDSIVM